MKTIELSTGTLLVSSGSVPIDTDLDGFQLLGHPSEITGEVCGKVVEEVTLFGFIKIDPTASGLSLCAAHNIQESDVLLFKAKNS